MKQQALTRIAPDIPYTSAAIVGCAVMTGFGSVTNAAKVRPGSSVVVLGVGGVGLNAIQGARICGAARIIAVDRNSPRLEAARAFGATDLVHSSANDPELLQAAAEVTVLNGGRGADYCFESTGNPLLGAAPLAFIRNGGTAIQMSGIEQSLSVDMSLFEWDKIYLNPIYGKCRPEVDFPRLFELYRTGKLLLDELVTRTYPLDALDVAFDDLLKGRNAKGVIVFE